MPPGQSISEAAARRGLNVILFNTFFMWAGFFMVIPLISVYYVDRLGWAATAIGLVLAVRQLVQQGLGLVTGMLADRFGVKWLICAGLFVRMIGFASMAFAATFPMLLLSAVLAALGGSLFDAPKSAAIAALTDPTNRSRYYSLVGVVSGLGVTIGTQIGALLLSFDFSLVALGAASCYIVIVAVTIIFLPPVRVASVEGGFTKGIGLALRDKPFMIFNVLMMGYWFMWVQFSISLPLAASAIWGSTVAVSWIYGVNSGMTILLQYPLIRLADRYIHPMLAVIIGGVVMALGLGGVALAGGIGMLLACVVLISLGSILGQPSQQTVVAGLCNPAALGSYFGISSLALALGGGLGNYSGGLLYDIGKQTGLPALPWLVFCAVGLATSAGMFIMYIRRRGQVETPMAEVAVAAAVPVVASGATQEPG